MQRNDPRASPAAQEQDLTAAFTEPSGDLPDAAVLPAGVIPVPSPPGKDGRVCRCLVYCLHSPHCREGRQGHRGYLGEEPGQSRGAACDVLLEAWRKPLSRQIITPVGFLRVAEPTQSRDRDVPAVAGRSHSGSACSRQHLLHAKRQCRELLCKSSALPKGFFSQAFLARGTNRTHRSCATLCLARRSSRTFCSPTQVHSVNFSGQTTTILTTKRHLGAPT